MTKDSVVTFGDWLRHRRKVGDLTQEELARQVGCSTIALRKIEAEERRPSKQTAERLAEILGITLEERPAFVRFARGDPFATMGRQLGLSLDSNPWRKTLPRLPHGSVPVPITSLVGREQDLADIRRYLLAVDTRQLTIIGPPGVGKTRLALQAACGLNGEFQDGVFFIALSPLRDPSLVATTIAQTLGIQETEGRSIVETLQLGLYDRQAMLVLDNFEHVVDAAPFVLELLMTCPNIKILITSRVALCVPGERLYIAAPLALPDPASLQDLEIFSHSASVALFLDRAEAVQPTFHLTSENAAAVAAICTHTNGLPLAIELIATLTPLLTPQAILARLDSGIMMHIDSRRGVPARLRTLQDTIQWSYDLLKPDEQTVCTRLAVFSGGFTLEAAESICGNVEGRVKPSLPPLYSVLNSLLNQSLLKREADANDETRYTMLDMIHLFMLERLEDGAEAEAIRRRHARYYLEYIERAASNFIGPEQAWWLNRVEGELDNLRKALKWSLERSELEMAAHLCISMPWKMRFQLSEGRGWLGKIITSARDAGLPLSLLAALLNEEGDVAYLQCDYASSHAAHEEALSLAREAGDKRAIAFALYGLGNLAINQKAYNWTAVLSDECLPLAMEIDDKWLAAMVLNILGEMARLQSDFELAITRYTEGLALLRQLGDKFFTTILLDNLGTTRWHQGNNDEAAGIFAECLKLANQFDNTRQMALALERLAKVAILRKQPEKAGRLLGAAGNFRKSAGIPMEAMDRADYELIVAGVRQQLNEATFDSVWEVGMAMTPEQVVHYALSDES